MPGGMKFWGNSMPGGLNSWGIRCGGIRIRGIECSILQNSFLYRKSVRLGEHRLSTDPDCTAGGNFCNDHPQDFDIEEVEVHPDYGSPQVFRNDIALIRLSKPANFSGIFS